MFVAPKTDLPTGSLPTCSIVPRCAWLAKSVRPVRSRRMGRKHGWLQSIYNGFSLPKDIQPLWIWIGTTINFREISRNESSHTTLSPKFRVGFPHNNWPKSTSMRPRFFCWISWRNQSIMSWPESLQICKCGSSEGARWSRETRSSLSWIKLVWINVCAERTTIVKWSTLGKFQCEVSHVKAGLTTGIQMTMSSWLEWILETRRNRMVQPPD